jgi:hypothetical protein
VRRAEPDDDHNGYGEQLTRGGRTRWTVQAYDG